MPSPAIGCCSRARRQRRAFNAWLRAVVRAAGSKVERTLETLGAPWDRPERAPLLIVGAGEDKTVKPSVSRAQYKKYERSPAKTDYLEFEGRPHLFVVVEPSSSLSSRNGSSETGCSTVDVPTRDRSLVVRLDLLGA